MVTVYTCHRRKRHDIRGWLTRHENFLPGSGPEKADDDCGRADVRTRLRPESAASKRCFPYKVWLTVRATGDNFNAVRKREFGVAAADVPQVVLEVVQQVNHGAAHGHRE